MTVGRFTLRPDWGQIAFATALMAWIVWYYLDAYAASPNVQNMLLIRPVTIVTLILYLVIVYQSLNLTTTPIVAPVAAETAADGTAGSDRDRRAPLIAAALILYVVALPYLGFDVATAAFLAAAVAAAGERRLWVIALIAIGLAGFLSLGFKFALSTPVPTLIL